MRTRLLLSLTMLFAALASHAATLPKPERPVTDKAGILSGNELALLEEKAAALEKAKLAQLVIYLVPELPEGAVLETLTLDSVNEWGVGRKDVNDGLAIFAFLKDRRLRIEVGLGLEQVITDEIAARVIQEQLAPAFRAEKYGEGLSAAVDELTRVLETHGDPRVAWLRQNATRLQPVDASGDDLSDLEPLRRTLSGVRVVMLGEQSHGDGTTFLAKTRLIRFLHERMGFNILAFESGLYDCPKAWEFLVNGEEPRAALSRGIFAIWSKSREVQPLLDYIGDEAKSAHPLEVAGIDSQTTGSAAEQFLAADLAAYLSRIDPKLAEGAEWDRVARVIGLLNQSAWELREAPVPSAEEQAAFARTIERWQSLIAARDRSPATQPWSGSFWRQLLASLRAFAEQDWRTDYTTNATRVDGTPVSVFTMRDVQMGKNLIWLANERYPREKIIVWAATGHIARALPSVRTSDPKYARLYTGWTPMGEIARKTLGEQLYALGFLSYEGEAARFAAKTATIVQSSRDSLEDLFARASFESALLDFRHLPAGHWLRSPLTAKLLGHTEMQADWTGVVDGVVFLRKMDRSHKN
ncbi:MAG TPA: erythromycin esterase family protein [Thermoanaerobaculia bacterium]|nr:erythromycin esterase family protein [Thermoanaerobaculia bacterium]